MDTPPYDYSPIVHRPRLTLPNGARLAVWIGINVEHYRWGQPALSLAPFTAELVPDPTNYGWRDYGPRVGIWRLMDALDRVGIRASAITNSEVCLRYPQIVEEVTKRDWAIVAHGRDNSTWQTGMEYEDERVFIEQIATELASATGRRPAGWLGPALTATANTYDVLAELGFKYTLDWTNDDQPYRLNVASGSLVSVPYSSEVNDIPAFVIHHQTGEQFAQSVIDQCDTLYEEGGDAVRVLGIGIHPFLVGQPFRMRHFALALEHIAQLDAVWLATSDEIASWYVEASNDAG
jgi:peptidoglycan/xylan/chitin deacetylase (PgdA/CDA1 family)